MPLPRGSGYPTSTFVLSGDSYSLPQTADVEDVAVVEEELPGAVAVVGVGVEDREPPVAVLLPQVDDAERDVVEAAVSTEEVPPGVVPAGADEREGVADLPFGDLLPRHHHAARRMPGGGAERVPLHPFDQPRGMDLQNQFPRNGPRFVELDPLVPQDLVQRRRENPPAAPRPSGSCAGKRKGGRRRRWRFGSSFLSPPFPCPGPAGISFPGPRTAGGNSRPARDTGAFPRRGG